MKELTKFEEIILVTIFKISQNAYGVKIRQHIIENLKKDITYGNLYSALDQLTQKGYVTKEMGEPTPNRRGRRKIYYQITNQGTRALQHARDLNQSLWAGLPAVLSSIGGKS